MKLSRTFTIKKKEPLFVPMHSQDELTQLGAITFSEAGNDPQEIRGVAATILNRAREKGVKISDVALPKQFSGMLNPQYQTYFSNKRDIPSQKKYDEVQRVIGEISTGRFRDPTNGANFFARSPMVPRYITNGSVKANLGGHYFYKGDPDYPTRK